MKEQKTNSGPL